MAEPKRDFDEFLEKFKKHRELMLDELHKVVIGQEAVIEQILAAIFTGGHCLLVGVPGLAKTLVVSTIARILDVQFKRIQFTPDLMPSDITGTNVLDEGDGGRREFRFVKGPVFTNVLLADEINRTPPKTQAALLQSMQEREVTVGQETYPLPEPFFVIATQNPIEQEGTYPLPEAQLDRFMFNVKVDYPRLEEEERILTTTTSGERAEVRKVLSAKSILYLQKQITQIECAPLMINYIARLVRATRPADGSAPSFIRDLVDWGAGPRAGQYLIMGARAVAAMDGRPAVSFEDVRHVAVPVLRHRISPNFQAQAEGMASDDIVNRLLQEVPEPSIPKYQ
ncbi:MAG: MoxR family ATPase [Planctomyces sp.]|nr:MoxR family ATPase [Planctomyces sp.]